MEKTEFRVVEQTDSLTHARLQGRLDTVGIGQVEAPFLTAVCPAGKPTLVDVSGVTFLASLGIRMFVSASRTLARKGAKLVLYAPAPLVRDSMQRAGLGEMLPMAADAQAARTMLGL
jgi:anti-anti-sigma factor